MLVKGLILISLPYYQHIKSIYGETCLKRGVYQTEFRLKQNRENRLRVDLD
jgi:hypothetical protein